MKRDLEMEARLDPMAVACFRKAILSGRCGELMAALFNGASCTIDMVTKELVIIPPEAMDMIGGE